MPRSSSYEPTTKAVTQTPDANKPAPAASPQAFTPWAKLIAFAADPRRLDVSAPVQRLLALCLLHAGPLGRGDGTQPEEAMFWMRRDGLAEALGCKPATVTRSARRLIALGLLRTRRIEALQLLPTGQRASRTCTVFYVHIGRLSELIGVAGTVRAGGIIFDPTSRIKNDPTSRIIFDPGSEPKPPDFSAIPGAPCESVSGFSAVVKDLNHRSPDLRADARDGGGCGSEFLSSNPETEKVVAYWWRRIGQARLGGDEPRGSVVNDVRRAVEAAFRATWTLQDCFDVVDGVCDRELGGKSFDYCRERRIWGGSIFRGCMDKLVEAVHDNRERLLRDTQRAQESFRPRNDVPVPKPAWLPDSMPAQRPVRMVRRP